MLSAGMVSAQEADSISVADQVMDTTYRNKVNAGDYFTFAMGGGLHTMQYKMDNPENDRDSRPGMTFEMGYQHFFKNHPHWGIGSGVYFRTFSTNAEFNYEMRYKEVDSQGEEYEHLVIYDNFHERQRLLCLGIPVMAFYQKEIKKSWRLVAGAGLLGSWQVLGKAKLTKGEVITEGYFDNYHCTMYGMENHWFMDFDNMKAKFKSKLQISSVAECTMNYVLKNNPEVEFFGGVYGQIVMDDVHKQKGDDQFDYRSESFNGALKTDIINKVHPYSVGAKIGIRYYFAPEEREPLPPLEPERPVVVETPAPVDTIPEPPAVVEEEPVVEEPPVIVEEPVKEEPPVVEEPVVEEPPVIVEQPVVEEQPQTPEDPYPPIPKRIKELPKKITINCDFNASDPQYSGHTELLNDIAEYLIAHPWVKYVCTGHTDNVGSYQGNYNLGLRRAKEVKAELIRRGVNPAQISAVSKSFSEPLVPNDSAENRAKNRRVEMEFIGREEDK